MVSPGSPVAYRGKRRMLCSGLEREKERTAMVGSLSCLWMRGRMVVVQAAE